MKAHRLSSDRTFGSGRTAHWYARLRISAPRCTRNACQTSGALSSPKWCLCELVPVGDLEHDPLTVASRAVCARRLARDRARAQLVADEIRQLPEAPAAVSLEADVGDEAAVMAAAAEVDAAWGRVDALINNAGWMPGNQPVLDVEVAVLERVLRSNVIGSFLTTKHFAPLMIRGGGGRIIYLSSVIGAQAGPGGAPYGGSKAAVNILANVAHQELADKGSAPSPSHPGSPTRPACAPS